MAKSLLQQAGFAEESLDIMLGIEWWECYEPVSGLHYYDAVGDLTLVNEKWGPSIGAGQVRSLRHPEQYPFPDTLRIAEELLDPLYNAQACWHISGQGANFTPWSVYNSGKWESKKGEDFELHSGHPNADRWDE